MVYNRFPMPFGDYLLAFRIASGGMADVYCARPLRAGLQRLVAIKCMRPEVCADPAFATMFAEEARLAARLVHANIVQIFDLGRVDDQPYIAMELVHGRDLAALIRVARENDLELPLGVCAYVIARAAEALDYAHALRALDGEPYHLVHGDVSPQNILVSFEGAVKLADFGIAGGGRREERRSLQGKFAYMAPEQAVKGAIDYRVDLFALGAVLFELVTGRPLFDAESKLGVLDKVRRAEMPRLEMTDPRIRGELLDILRVALAADRNQRYQRGADFAEALAPLLIDEGRIVGVRQTAELMQSLFGAELPAEQERLRQALTTQP